MTFKQTLCINIILYNLYTDLMYLHYIKQPSHRRHVHVSCWTICTHYVLLSFWTIWKPKPRIILDKSVTYIMYMYWKTRSQTYIVYTHYIGQDNLYTNVKNMLDDGQSIHRRHVHVLFWYNVPVTISRKFFTQTSFNFCRQFCTERSCVCII